MKKLFFFLILASGLQAQTRFYLSNGIAAPIGASLGNAAWSDTTQLASRIELSTSPIGSTMGNLAGNIVTATALDSIVIAQYISEPLLAQTISGANVKGQIRAAEGNNADNCTIAFALYVVSNNGDTLRGMLANTKASDAATRPPEFVVTTLTNRQLQNSAEAASISLSTVNVSDGDRIVFELGFRENSTTDRAININVGDNAASDLAEDNTTTTANNPWFEISQTLTFEESGGTVQLPVPCGAHSGDYLFAVGNGQDSALTPCCSQPNWQNVNDSTCVADSNYVASTTLTWDWYRMRAKDVGTDGGVTWKRHDANEEIDCIGVEVCATLGHGSSGTLTIELAAMDSINGRDTVFLGRWTSTTPNTDLTFSGYFWNFDGASQAGGNKWFKMDRPDSLWLSGLQIGVGIAVNSTAQGRHAVLKNVKAIVYAHTRDTTVADSINPDFQVTACSTATGASVIRLHQFGAAMSNTDASKIWAAEALDSTTDKFYVVHSNDTGKTWTAADPDRIIWRRAVENAAIEDRNGPILVQDTSSGRPDSLFIGIIGMNAGSNKFVTGHSRSPSTTPGRWGVDGSGDPLSSVDSGHVDSLSRQNRLLAPINGGQFYQLGDTVWAATMDTISAFNRSSLKWWRSKDNGKTWPDTGYIPTVQLGTNSYDINPRVCSLSTTAAQWCFVRWKKGYPAIVIAGWTRDSARGLQSHYVHFLRWHPSWDSSSYVAKADSMFRYAWLRDATKRIQATDTLTIQRQTVTGSVLGMLAATTIFRSDHPDSPVVHVAWMYTPHIRSNTIKYDWTTGTNPNSPYYVAEISNNANGNNQLINLTMTSKDTLVYLFFTMLKNEPANDTCTIAWTLNCESAGGGGLWRGPRPLFMIKTSEVLFRWVGTPQYQYNDHRIVAFAPRGSVRASAARAALVVGHIIRAGNYAAAGGANPTPLRRRRLIIEKNYKTGSLDESEKDSVPDWAGLRLPDWDDTAK